MSALESPRRGGRAAGARPGSGLGFTLIEMLIAIAITALLVSVAVESHLGIRHAQARAAGSLHRDRVAQVLLDRLEGELSGTLMLRRPDDVDRLAHPFVFLGRSDRRDDADADALLFVTRSPARVGPSNHAEGLSLVFYRAVRSGDGTGPAGGAVLPGMVLMRDEIALPDRLDRRLNRPDSLPVVRGLARFDLHYSSGGATHDLERWDSGDLAHLDSLPESVSVEVQLWDADADGEPILGATHTRTIALPVREIDIAALRTVAAPAAETCVSAGECARRYQDLLAGDDKLQSQVDSELADQGEACFDPDSLLAELLRKVGGSPDEECR